MQHCKRNSMPIIWSQKTYAEQGLGEKWEEQARFGYRHGIAMALHMPEGRHFFLGVDRDQPVPADPVSMTRLVADLQLFAVHAQDAALRILTPAMNSPGAPSLTPRELETLRWTMEGKDGLGGRQPARHQRADGCPARQQRDTQAGLREQASGCLEGTEAWPHPLAAACKISGHRACHHREGLPTVRVDSYSDLAGLVECAVRAVGALYDTGVGTGHAARQLDARPEAANSAASATHSRLPRPISPRSPALAPTVVGRRLRPQRRLEVGNPAPSARAPRG